MVRCHHSGQDDRPSLPCRVAGQSASLHEPFDGSQKRRRDRPRYCEHIGAGAQRAARDQCLGAGLIKYSRTARRSHQPRARPP